MRNKQEIIEFLGSHTYHDDCLAWNVKARTPDCDFDHLLEVYRKSGHYASDEKYLDDPEWRAEAKKLHDAERLYEWAVEEAQTYVIEETQWQLPSGKEVTACFGFAGRSNGWIILHSFEGIDCQRPVWREWDFPTLKKLGNFIQERDSEFTQSKANEEIELRAAYFFVDDICAGISRPV